jgi:hypothetical protein
VPLRGQINRAIAISRVNFVSIFPTPPLDQLAQESKSQHLAPTVRATNKPPAMAPKRASSKAAPSVDEAAKAALLAEKKGKALTDNTLQEACEDEALSTRQRHEHPTPEGTLRTCSSRGLPQAPPQASLHQRAKTQQRTTRSSESQPKSNYSRGPCASRTTTSKNRKISSKPCADVSPRKPRCVR